MKFITTLELDSGCFLYMVEAYIEPITETNLHWYIGSIGDLVRVSDEIAFSLFSLRQTKNNDPLREDFNSVEWKSECVARYENWIDFHAIGKDN